MINADLVKASCSARPISKFGTVFAGIGEGTATAKTPVSLARACCSTLRSRQLTCRRLDYQHFRQKLAAPVVDEMAAIKAYRSPTDHSIPELVSQLTMLTKLGCHELVDQVYITPSGYRSSQAGCGGRREAPATP